MKYLEYKNINYSQVASEMLDFWRKNNIFEKSVTTRENAPSFTFYEGPPSANGTPGIHHVMSRAVKDIFCRYKTLKGFQVKRKGGWDTHGLPVELQVEKELGITKEDIGKKISIEEYNQKCRETVMRFKDQWDQLTEKMGYWVDLNDPYITFDKNYMETLWWLLKQLYEKDLLYKGYTIQPYSPAAGTGLSSHELNQPGCYRPVKDTTIVAQFLLEGKENEYLLAWTTTPWTLPANSALAVGKNIAYVKVDTFNPYTHQPIRVILAKDRLDTYFDPKAKEVELSEYNKGDTLIPYKIIDTFKGKALVGLSYKQLMPYITLPKPAFTVVEGDFVTTEDGTGIVHLAKTFGADDYRTCVKNNIPGIVVEDQQGNETPIVDKQGRYVKEITDFAGKFVKNEYYPEGEAPEKSLDVEIAIKLKQENKAFKVEKYEHTYPHCWRTDKPILYYPLESWFIKTTAYKKQLVELNNTINWKPKSTGIGRFGHWLENLVDWNLSRTRFWGTPLPIWRTKDGKEEKCIGSLDELTKEVEKAIKAGIDQAPISDNFDLHRPYVDEIILVSEQGEKMYREQDLIDVWFDSGAMPYAQWHYPFEKQDRFKESFPADFIAEGVDQTRGWFFTLHVLATMIFDSVAFKNVIANGLVLDKNGQKMSKRLGNTVDPFKTLDQYGPDATRWYMIVNANPWDNLKFDESGILEIQRKFFGTLSNTYAFFALYANLDKFTYDEASTPLHQRTESDRWIISKLNSLIDEVDAAYRDYEPTKAARLIQDFTTNDLSNWYVRLNRKRFWKGEYNDDKKAAYQTLYDCLVIIAKLSAPIAPFYMDFMFRNLNNVGKKEDSISVHLSDFPVSNHSLIETSLEERMKIAQQVSSLVHSLRKKHKIKVRQPLSKILIPVLSAKTKENVEAVKELILTEVNVKDIEYIDDDSSILKKKVKPNFKKLGKAYGPKMKEIAHAISNLTNEEISVFEKSNQFSINTVDQQIILTLDDVEISSEDIPGWSVANQGNLTVALDIQLTDELKQEGIARDLVNRIQNLRKDMGLAVQDKIKISIEKNQELVNQALQNNKEYICEETQAIKLSLEDQLNGGQVLEIEPYQLMVKVEK